MNSKEFRDSQPARPIGAVLTAESRPPQGRVVPASAALPDSRRGPAGQGRTRAAMREHAGTWSYQRARM